MSTLTSRGIERGTFVIVTNSLGETDNYDHLWLPAIVSSLFYLSRQSMRALATTTRNTEREKHLIGQQATIAVYHAPPTYTGPCLAVLSLLKMLSARWTISTGDLTAHAR